MYLESTVKDLESEIEKLKEQLCRTQHEFSLFYEITRLMRSSLRLDELLYIILTGITAHNGLAFNRAALFFVNYEKNKIEGTYAIGPAEHHEAEGIWRWIEETESDMYDLISSYRNDKRFDYKSPIMRLIERIQPEIGSQAGILNDVIQNHCMLHVKPAELPLLKHDPLFDAFGFRECVLVPLWARNRIIGIIYVDNLITSKPIEESEKDILNMFASQAALAIENSYLYEDSITKAHTDPLTGLWNHGYFRYKYDELYDEAVRYKKNLSLIMLDVDNFKKYNDSYGHLEGDMALVCMARILKAQFRKNDVVCRWGGEEFIVILPEIDKAEAVSIAERMRQAVEELPNCGKKITVSVGVVDLSYDQSRKNSLLEEVDRRLYVAKKTGKNRVVF